MNWKLATPCFFDRQPAVVARELLGAKLIRRWNNVLIEGLIVETEAYLSQDDPASHSFAGVRPRNRWMFGPPGSLYVYTIHRRFCLNAVTEATGIGSAVLIRALQPLNQIELLQAHRQRNELYALTSGPAKICEALQINLTHNGLSLCEPIDLWIELPIADAHNACVLHEELCDSYSSCTATFNLQQQIAATPRIGISKAKELPLRFILTGNSFLSRKK
jgi:DNA-3-methyladenine glycosylase